MDCSSQFEVAATLLLQAVTVVAAVAAPAIPRACSQPTTDRLPSWQNRPAKMTILRFVQRVADRFSTNYLRPEERIAAFDDGGTLCAEWPLQLNRAQIAFAHRRIQELAKNQPGSHRRLPFEAFLEPGEDAGPGFSGLWNVVDLLRVTSGAMNLDEFGAIGPTLFAMAGNPKFTLPCPLLAYKPILELLALLRANDFKVFIVTSTGSAFRSGLAERLYGVGSECIIRISGRHESKETIEDADRGSASNVVSLNEKTRKDKKLLLQIGRRPILVAGNTDSDLATMELAAGGKSPFLNLLVLHDDPEREFAYQQGSTRLIEAALARGWTTVSMKSDFKTVFSFSDAAARDRG